jgi:hypothetical protein
MPVKKPTVKKPTVKKGGDNIIDVTDYYTLVSEPNMGGLSSVTGLQIFASKSEYIMYFHTLPAAVRRRFQFIFNVVTHEFLNNEKFTKQQYTDIIGNIVEYMKNAKVNDNNLRVIEKKYGWDKNFMLRGTMTTPIHSPQ